MEPVREETGRRLALVAGGSGFLGGAVARELARRGWLVGVHCFRHPERAERAARDCEGAGGRALVLRGDLALGEEAGRVIRDYEAASGAPPRLLVVATGLVRDAPLLRAAEADWDDVLAANLSAPANVLRAAARTWEKTGGGHAVLIGSHAGLVELGGGRAGGAAYGASKAALVGLARSVARELGPPEKGGVRVNVAVPPFVTGGMGAGASPGFVREARAKSVQGRTGDADEFARFVADLAETEGVSGQVLCADTRPAAALPRGS